MKKKLFLMLPLVALMLSACGGRTPVTPTSSEPAPTSESIPSEPETTEDTSEEPSETTSKLPTVKEVTILCYLDYNHANNDSDAYFTAKWYYGVPFTKADIGLVDPTEKDANYPEFKTFLGWSLQPIIDSPDQLLKWGEYVKLRDGSGSYVNLYGIWVG